MAHLGFLVLCISLCAAITLCSDSCGQLFANKVSVADRKTILDKHNSVRSLIRKGKVPNQPKGINLKILAWDDILAQKAQKIADTCVYGHVTVKDDRFPWGNVGQNIAYWPWNKKHAGKDWPEIIEELWFGEHVNFTYPNTSRGETGHYRQVVWADTYAIGCGFSSYSNDSLVPGWNIKFFICNYGPAGNYPDQAPYKI